MIFALIAIVCLMGAVYLASASSPVLRFSAPQYATSQDEAQAWASDLECSLYEAPRVDDAPCSDDAGAWLSSMLIPATPTLYWDDYGPHGLGVLAPTSSLGIG